MAGTSPAPTAPKLPTLAELSQQAKNGDAYAKNAVASWSGGGGVDPNEWVFNQGTFQKNEDYLNDFEKKLHNNGSYSFSTGNGGDSAPPPSPTPPSPGGGNTGPGGGSLGGLRSMAMGGQSGGGGGMAGLGALFGGVGAMGGATGPSGDPSTALDTPPPMSMGPTTQAGSNPASEQMIAGPGAMRPLGQRNPPSLDALLKVRAY